MVMKDRKKEISNLAPSKGEMAAIKRDVTAALEGYVRGFAKRVTHGDAEHQEWMEKAVEAYLSGQPIPPVRGE